jgi:hypothetical protein
MNRRGVEFTLVQVDADLWQWQFRIGEAVTSGRTQTRLKGMAARRAEQRIDIELRKLSEPEPGRVAGVSRADAS